jgi:hypothetical protein
VDARPASPRASRRWKDVETMQHNDRPKVVLLGMVTKMPVAGAIWGTLQYLIGFRRLGFDVYYVEAHARTPSMLMERRGDDATRLAVDFLASLMRRFDFDGRWAFHALHDDGRCYGLDQAALGALYRSAELVINYHGGTVPTAEHCESKRLALLETDPVELEIDLHDEQRDAIDFLAPHTALFTWGLNYGNADCRVPLPEGLTFRRTRAPVIMDLWAGGGGDATTFTTIGNWRQAWRSMRYQGELYTWSKHFEFLKFIDLPKQTPQPLELALSSYTADDQRLLEANGWRIRPAQELSSDLDAYRRYVMTSLGEFTVAKDQNVRLRSGWFSERSAQYLAAGRPVITQETGFSNCLPTGEGLFAFSTMSDILAAIEAINSDYDRHSRAATQIARDYFSYERVLTEMLDAVGLAVPKGREPA